MDKGEGEGETERGGGEGVGGSVSGSSLSGTRKGNEREVVVESEAVGGEDGNLSEGGGVGAACGMDGVEGEVSSDNGEFLAFCSVTLVCSLAREYGLVLILKPFFPPSGSIALVRRDDGAGNNSLRGLTIGGSFVRDGFWKGPHLASSFFFPSLILALSFPS